MNIFKRIAAVLITLGFLAAGFFMPEAFLLIRSKPLNGNFQAENVNLTAIMEKDLLDVFTIMQSEKSVLPVESTPKLSKNEALDIAYEFMELAKKTSQTFLPPKTLLNAKAYIYTSNFGTGSIAVWVFYYDGSFNDQKGAVNITVSDDAAKVVHFDFDTSDLSDSQNQYIDYYDYNTLINGWLQLLNLYYSPIKISIIEGFDTNFSTAQFDFLPLIFEGEYGKSIDVKIDLFQHTIIRFLTEG